MRARKMTLTLPIWDIAYEETWTEKWPDTSGDKRKAQ